jgi:hypothetical protein
MLRPSGPRPAVRSLLGTSFGEGVTGPVMKSTKRSP